MARVRYGARTEAEIAAARTASSKLPDIWSTGVVAVWERDPDAVAAVLPPPLKLIGRPLVRVSISKVDLPGYPLGAGSFAVAAAHAGVEGWYPLVMPMTHERALIGGHEVFGEPKKLGEVTVDREGPVVRASLARHGIAFVEVRGAVGGDLPLPEPVQKTDFYFKFLPAVDVFQILLNDVDEAVKEIRWAAGAGLEGGLLLPGTPPGSGLPELYSSTYDPIWVVGAELGVPVNHHAGSASPPLGDEPAARAVFMVETTWFSHRALWHLVFGGAFRRHPELRLVLTEQGSGWIPGRARPAGLLPRTAGGRATRSSTAESKFGAGLAASMGKGPSRVWRAHCWVGASFMRPHEVPLRDRIGLDRIMWGATTRTTRAPTPTPERACGSRTRVCPGTRSRRWWAATQPACTASTSASSTRSRRRWDRRWRRSRSRWENPRRTRRARCS
jgi:hypothetical protein